MVNKVLGFSAVIIPENGSYSSWAPELDVASQGGSIEEALANLKEAVGLHLDCMTPKERKDLLGQKSEQIVTSFKLEVSA